VHALHPHGPREQGGLRRRPVPSDLELSRPDPPQIRPAGSPEESVVLTYKVPGELVGLRLDRFIQHRIPRLSRTRAQAIIRACAVHVDGKRRRPSDIVRSGETVYLVRERFQEPETPLEFGTVYQDEFVLVVDKPAGLPMHPSATYHKHTLSYLLKEHYEGQFVPRLAHRLDRETSGLVVCARTLESERRLKRAFALHGVQKTYLAIVRGEVPMDQGEMTQPMAPVREGLHVLMEIRDHGLLCVGAPQGAFARGAVPSLGSPASAACASVGARLPDHRRQALRARA
jgi:23S rRNA pseudouridine1911/1915/1917 synthase